MERGFLGDEIEGDDLFVIPSGTAFEPGSSIFLDIHLGASDNLISDIYGIGFQLRFDTQYVEDVLFDFTETWIGNDEEVLSYGKFSDAADHIGVALTRLDGNSVSGSGKIGQVEIVITDVILGLEADSTACLPFELVFENVLGVDLNEQDLLISARSNKVDLKHPSQISSVGTIDTGQAGVKIYPNPSSGWLDCRSTGALIQSMELYDQLGRLIHAEHLTPAVFYHRLQLHHLSSGLYFLETQTPKGKTVQRLLIQ